MQLVFGRDSILPIKFQADWELIKARKLTMIEKNNDRENEKRIPYEYKIGDKVGIYLDPTRKHGADKAKGPFTITRVYDNGTVRLRQRTQRGGAVHQTWNIRNIFPYKA
jgi:hypothetical protein